MFAFKNSKEVEYLHRYAPIVEDEETGLIAIGEEDSDDTLLPGLSTQSYVFTQKALLRKKRLIRKILQQADTLLLNESK